MKHLSMLALGIAVSALVACGESMPTPPAVPGANGAAPAGTTTKHGTGQGGGHHSGGKTGEASGNKDGVAGGTTTEHGSGHGAGRGGGKKAHTGDKNGKPGPQS